VQKPSLGRIVLATVHPTTNNGSDTAPAVITRVFSDDLVNIRVLLDGVDRVEAKTSIALYPDRAALDAAKAQRDQDQPHNAGYTFTGAYWPPRV
jgi:hypothetical protein